MHYGPYPPGILSAMKLGSPPVSYPPAIQGSSFAGGRHGGCGGGGGVDPSGSQAYDCLGGTGIQTLDWPNPALVAGNAPDLTAYGPIQVLRYVQGDLPAPSDGGAFTSGGTPLPTFPNLTNPAYNTMPYDQQNNPYSQVTFINGSAAEGRGSANIQWGMPGGQGHIAFTGPDPSPHSAAAQGGGGGGGTGQGYGYGYNPPSSPTGNPIRGTGGDGVGVTVKNTVYGTIAGGGGGGSYGRIRQGTAGGGDGCSGPLAPYGAEPATNGGANSGGGGGGFIDTPGGSSGAGGSGIVVIGYNAFEGEEITVPEYFIN
jgi:hypothetical protein